MRWQARVRTKRTTDGLLTVEELQSAKKAIVARVQHDVYFSEISYLNQFSEVVSAKREFKTSLLRLKPTFSAGLLCVGGRLRRSSEEFDIKDPVILPPDAHVTRLIVEDFHVRMGHSGMARTWTLIRQRYWIIKGAAAVRKILEVEYIIDSRPLTPLLMDPEHDAPLTPNHLKMLRGNCDQAPGIFQSDDQYSRKRWRQV